MAKGFPLHLKRFIMTWGYSVVCCATYLLYFLNILTTHRLPQRPHHPLLLLYDTGIGDHPSRFQSPPSFAVPRAGHGQGHVPHTSPRLSHLPEVYTLDSVAMHTAASPKTTDHLSSDRSWFSRTDAWSHPAFPLSRLYTWWQLNSWSDLPVPANKNPHSLILGIYLCVCHIRNLFCFSWYHTLHVIIENIFLNFFGLYQLFATCKIVVCILLLIYVCACMCAR